MTSDHAYAPGGPPVLDEEVLRHLGDDLRDHQVAQNFADEVTGRLSGRAMMLRNAVSRRDVEAATDSALTLKVTSSAVGGRRLEEATQHLIGCIRLANWAAAHSAIDAVMLETVRLGRALRERPRIPAPR